MDRETARENIRARLKEYVERVTERSSRAGGNMYICPLCGSGSGSHGTGAFSITGDKWKCFVAAKAAIYSTLSESWSIPLTITSSYRVQPLYLILP